MSQDAGPGICLRLESRSQACEPATRVVTTRHAGSMFILWREHFLRISDIRPFWILQHALALQRAPRLRENAHGFEHALSTQQRSGVCDFFRMFPRSRLVNVLPSRGLLKGVPKKVTCSKPIVAFPEMSQQDFLFDIALSVLLAQVTMCLPALWTDFVLMGYSCGRIC